MGSLNNQQQMFIEEYFKDFNATQAAIRAGYSERTAYSQGHRLLKKAEIALRVRERLNEAAMEANEVLFHLAAIARGDMNDLISNNGLPDIQTARERGKTGLIKKWKFRTITTEDSDIHEVEVEPYDRIQALNLLAKYHQLTTTSNLRVDDWRSQLIADIKAGLFTYEDVAGWFDDSLASELFAQANIRVSEAKDENTTDR